MLCMACKPYLLGMYSSSQYVKSVTEWLNLFELTILRK